jgi:transketolase
MQLQSYVFILILNLFLDAAWAEAGLVKKEDLLNLRKIDSDLEGHPTPRLNFVDVATGSLGQGLSAAAGMAYAAKYIEKTDVHIFCICGDGEMSEGSCWEALLFAWKYKLDNLTLIVDMNKFGQSEEAPHGHDTKMMKEKVEAFGAKTFSIDGHDINKLIGALQKARKVTGAPTAIIAKTYKGKFFTDTIEDKPGWHGKALEGEDAKKAIAHVQTLIHSEESKLTPLKPEKSVVKDPLPAVELRKLDYKKGDKIATRNSYGIALKAIGEKYKQIVALDGDTKNSTMAIDFAKACGERFVECYIAEQNMIGAAVGLHTRGLIPFVSAFAAFHTRSFDFIRMSAISQANLKIVGSHAGVHIGQDGPSQMGLEDFAMMRTIPNSLVLYPSDAVSTENAVVLAANYKGIVYMRTTRGATPVTYTNEEKFEIGKCKVHKGTSTTPKVTIVAGGITFFEALKAQEQLKDVIVIDVFSIKPIDEATIYACAKECGGKVLTVEDHYREGGIFGI